MGDQNHVVLNLQLVKALEQPNKATMLHGSIDLYLEINISKLFNQIKSNPIKIIKSIDFIILVTINGIC
jgi:hypothetical protein